MSSFASRILSAPLGKTHLFFLGQAGFVFKTSKGTLIGVDLYLSNCVERFDGFKRLMPYLLDPSEIIFDYIIATHKHYDHFDIDSISTLIENHQTHLIAAIDCKKDIEQLEIQQKKVTYVRASDQYDGKDLKIYAVFCDHGLSAPDAIGLIIELDDKKIYIAGDTSLRLDKAQEISRLGPFDLMIAPINGAFGNLNEEEAVLLCGFHQPRLFIPCHYWNFAEHGGNPGVFADLMNTKYPSQSYLLMTMGEGIVL